MENGDSVGLEAVLEEAESAHRWIQPESLVLDSNGERRLKGCGKIKLETCSREGKVQRDLVVICLVKQ